MFLVAFPGVAVLALLILSLAHRWFAQPLDRKHTLRLFFGSLLIVPILQLAQALAGGFAVGSLSTFVPLKYDLFVYRIDLPFGEPSFVLGQLAAQHPWLRLLIAVSYDSITVTMIATLAIYLRRRPEREAWRVAWAFTLNLFGAIPFYLLFPVSGPAFAFPNFPALPPLHLIPQMIPLAAAPNGVPSVHMSTALLILWFLWRWPWGRVAGSIFLALTILSTLGSGQHYFFDLLCAVPYAAGVIWFANSK